jgi:hypothetical protein
VDDPLTGGASSPLIAPTPMPVSSGNTITDMPRDTASPAL